MNVRGIGEEGIEKTVEKTALKLNASCVHKNVIFNGFTASNVKYHGQ